MTNMSEVTNHKITTDGNHSLVLAKELKSPLSSMLGTMDLLLTTAMTGKQKEYCKIAYFSGQSLMNSVQSVITFFEIKNNQFYLLERAPGVSVEEIKNATEGTLVVEGEIPEMNL